MTDAEKAMPIKLIAMDIDGVLTSGELYYTAQGDVMKAFHVHDGMGISLAQHAANIPIAIITGRTASSVAMRASELSIKYIYQGIINKLGILQSLCDDLGIGLNEVAYIGDDLNDLAVLRVVGFSAAPANARTEVKDSVDFVSTYKGGEGAVRDMIEFILKAQHKWNDILVGYQAVDGQLTQ